MERVTVIGIAHNQAGFGQLSKVSLSNDEAIAVGARLVEAGVSDPVILTTCNRLEFYHLDAELRLGDIVSAICEIKGADAVSEDDLFVIRGAAAIERLFRVASGLESLVLGEPEILGQVKAAYKRSTENGWITTNAARTVFDGVFRVAKKVRSDTAIGKGHFSVALTAIQVLENQAGDLSPLRILIVGAGKTGELAMRHFCDRTCSDIALANRTRARAETLAADIGCGEVIDLSDVHARAHEFDVIVSAVEGGNHVVEAADLQARDGQPTYVVDLSMPPSIPADIASVPGTSLIDIESLQGVVAASARRRSDAVIEAEEIIKTAMTTTELKLWEDSDLRPVVQHMRDHMADMLAEVFPNLAEEVVKKGAERLANMHVRKIRGIRDSVDERRARLQSLMTVYAGQRH